MTRFRRLNAAPDPTFRAEWNRLVRTVEQLLKISASPPLELSLISGSPHVRLAGRFPRATERARLTEALKVGGTAKAKLLRKSGGTWQEGDEIEVTDWGLDFPLPAGRRVIVDYHAQSGEWHVLTAQRVPLSPLIDVCCDDGDLVGQTAQIFVESEVNQESNPCGASAGSGDASSSVDLAGDTTADGAPLSFDGGAIFA